MTVFPFIRLEVIPEIWRRYYSAEYDHNEGKQKITQNITTSGRGFFKNDVCISGNNFPMKKISNFEVDVHFYLGSEKYFDQDDKNIMPNLLNSDEQPKSHCGWVQYFDHNDEKCCNIELSMFVPAEIFYSLESKVGLIKFLPSLISIKASASTLQSKFVETEWNVSEKKFLFIFDYSMHFPEFRVTPQTYS